jgi:hypothetical protein
VKALVWNSLTTSFTVSKDRKLYRKSKFVISIKKNEPLAFTALPHKAGMACPACGLHEVAFESDYPSNVKPFAQARVLYCAACGLGFVPDFAPTLEQFYKNDYAATNRKDRDEAPEVYFSDAYRAQNPTIKRYFSRSMRQLRLLRAHGATMGSVLDFGSGPGYFIHTARPVHRFAFEPDEASRKHLDWLGVKVIPTLAQIRPRLHSAIVASHSIEHLVAEELQSTLSRLITALRAGGRLLVEVPQGGHSYLHLRGARQDPHTLFFTPEALSRAITRAGGVILYEGALAKEEIPRRSNPIYQPAQDHAFFYANRGSLVVICKNSTDQVEL